MGRYMHNQDLYWVRDSLVQHVESNKHLLNREKGEGFARDVENSIKSLQRVNKEFENEFYDGRLKGFVSTALPYIFSLNSRKIRQLTPRKFRQRIIGLIAEYSIIYRYAQEKDVDYNQAVAMFKNSKYKLETTFERNGVDFDVNVSGESLILETDIVSRKYNINLAFKIKYHEHGIISPEIYHSFKRQIVKNTTKNARNYGL